MNAVTLACAQLPYRALDVEPGVARLRANVDYLAGLCDDRDPVDLLLLGEFWLSSPDGAADYAASAVTVGEVVDALGELARRRASFIGANVVERGDDGVLYDSTVLLDRAGMPALVYREIAAGTMPGSELQSPIRADGAPGGLARWTPVVETELGRIGAAVGSDLAYPELFNAMVLAGVDIVLHSAREPQWAAGAWQSLKPARCLEGGYFLVSCNIADSIAAVGQWGESCGHSRIVAPSGAVLAESMTADPAWVAVAIQPAEARSARANARFERRTSTEWRELCAGAFRD